MDRRKALKRSGLLAGAALLTPSVLTILQSCQQDTRTGWKPVFFNNEEADLVTAFSDTLLPRTETPGALDVKVDIVMDKIIDQTYDADGKKYFRGELAAFNQECVKNYGDVFAKLSTQDRNSFLKGAESSAGQFNSSVWGTAVGGSEPVGFYRSLKSMVLWLFTTSQQIGEEVLNYDPIPGVYSGCVPLSEVGNKWSL